MSARAPGPAFARRCRYHGRCGVACTLPDAIGDHELLNRMPCVMTMQKRTFYRYLLLSLLLSLAAGACAYAYTLWAGLRELAAHSHVQARHYGNGLEREIGKFGLVPLTAALDHDIIEYLQHAGDAGATDRINRYLKSLNDSVGAQRTYLIDPAGTIVATSNWNAADSFIGRDISYRPYFQHAQAGTVSPYYGIGTTGNASGYYLATAVEPQGRRLGLVAIKVTLEQLEHLWLNAGTPVLLSDANGVVVLSSEPQWKYGVLGPLTAALQRRLDASQQYNQHRLHAVGWQVLRRLDSDAQIVRIDAPGGHRRYLGVSQPLPELSMRLTILADPAPVYALALARGIAAAVMVAFAMVMLHAFDLWRLSIRERLSAQAALQAAHDRLEVLVEQRSAQLRAANEGLKREIAERVQAAQQAQSFQQELIHTENLAVIGQLSAGLAHEINQPLAALGTLSANAVRFLERGDLDTVRFNLERVTELVARMGVLTGQLRSFARRSNGELIEAPLAASIDNALALLGHQLRRGERPVQVVLSPPPAPLHVHCDPIRLEQVLVNLVSNAMDATAEAAAPRIELAWRACDGKVLIEVTDNGTGLSEEVARRLFEPFFTTKSRSGLGLGLAISADIVKSLGGQLSAANAVPGPGARFTIELPATHPPERPND